LKGITIYEFEYLTAASVAYESVEDLHAIPGRVFSWLQGQCLLVSESGESSWLRLTQRRGRLSIQVTSFVGVIRSPDGYQVEVLPKIGRNITSGSKGARELLIEMLCCLPAFRHVKTDSAKLLARRMPLLEVFIAEFLGTVEHIVKRGLRGDYVVRHDDLFSIRGKILVGTHLRRNLCRADRFFTEHDDFSKNRPENRLIQSALRQALALAASRENQQRARELLFVFAEFPASDVPSVDFQRVRLDRGMSYYKDALAWAHLILNEKSPLTGVGSHGAPSLLFPMEALFEAFVAKHLARQVKRPVFVKTQARGHHLVRHRDQNWFLLKPDLLLRHERDHLVLDTKWKLLDERKSTGTHKYGLSQSDFYQLQAYGLSYLDGEGDVVLIYPRTAEFDQPLPVFELPKTNKLRLWALPFCLKTKVLLLPDLASFTEHFR
jgi:5-methylcytosine-specific restriction enzyme subunit McrC